MKTVMTNSSFFQLACPIAIVSFQILFTYSHDQFDLAKSMNSIILIFLKWSSVKHQMYKILEIQLTFDKF